MTIPITVEDFWTHQYVKSLDSYETLALLYAFSHMEQSQCIIVEDMAGFTGFSYQECLNYLRRFINDGKVGKEDIGDSI